MGDLLVLLAHVTDDVGAAERPELRIVSRANDEVPGRFTFPAASRFRTPALHFRSFTFGCRPARRSRCRSLRRRAAARRCRATRSRCTASSGYRRATTAWRRSNPRRAPRCSSSPRATWLSRAPAVPPSPAPPPLRANKISVSPSSPPPRQSRLTPPPFPADLDDHVAWLVERRRFAEALEVAEARARELKRHRLQDLGLPRRPALAETRARLVTASDVRMAGGGRGLRRRGRARRGAVPGAADRGWGV